MSSISDLITQQAVQAGVDPSVALAVANQESGTQQWRSNGSLVTGSSGEIGVFQLMPATAAQLHVDPTDVNQNIAGGIAYLKQLYNQFGNWPSAVAAYNAGPGRVASGNIPSSTQSYVQSVLDFASNLVGGLTDPTSSSAADFSGGSAAPVGAIVIGLVGLLVLWWIVD